MTPTDRFPVALTDAALTRNFTDADGDRSIQVRFRLHLAPTATYGARGTFRFDPGGFPSEVTATLALEVPRITLHRGERRGSFAASVRDLAAPKDDPIGLTDSILPRHRLRADHPALAGHPIVPEPVAELLLEILTDACRGRRPSAVGRPFAAAATLLGDAALLLGVRGEIRLTGTHLALHDAPWPYRHLEQRLQAIALTLGADAGASHSEFLRPIDLAIARSVRIPAPLEAPSHHERMAAIGRLTAAANTPELAALLAPLLGGAI